MNKKNKKGTRNSSGGNYSNDPLKGIKKFLSDASPLKQDSAARRRQVLKDELEARTEKLKKQGFLPPEGIPFMDEGEFEQIIEKETAQKKDRVIWKAYSKRGGISDTLTDIRKAVEHPSVNAFEFYEEDGMYTIFITLNNTYISRLRALCSGMCSECEQMREMEDSKLRKERGELQKIYQNLCSEKEKLSQKSFQQQFTTVSRTKGEEQEKALDRLKSSLDSYEKEGENYAVGVKAYQERLAFFVEECREQQQYESKYDYDKLLRELTGLEEICTEGHPFHMLTISPEGEEELKQYMEVAYEFSKWALRITDEFPL